MKEEDSGVMEEARAVLWGQHREASGGEGEGVGSKWALKEESIQCVCRGLGVRKSMRKNKSPGRCQSLWP